MKIYVGHSKNMNYVRDLYEPILKSNISKEKYKFIFPHIPEKDLNLNREFYGNIDLFLAETSFPATGLGIELGYAADSNVPIVLLLKEGKKCNSNAKNIATSVLVYKNENDLIFKIENYLKENY